jgi:small conductance mechanosensitive channel
VGFLLVKYITKLIMKTMKKGKVEPTVKSFLGSMISVVLKILVIICALGTLGIDMTSIITVIGTATVAIGLALKDSMANIASGVLIIINKPFKVGDYLSTEGLEGTVHKIEMMYTTLISFDGKEIILPNSRVTSNNVINYNVEGCRRLDLPFSISYNDSIVEARDAIMEIINSDNRILSEPEPPVVGVDSHGESGINLIVKVWCRPEDYWALRYYIPEKVKYSFDERKITIPYNRLEVDILEKGNEK